MKLPTLVSTSLLQGAVRVAATTAHSIEPADCKLDLDCALDCSVDNAECFHNCCKGGRSCLIEKDHVEGCSEENTPGTDDFYQCLGNICSEELGGYDEYSSSLDEDDDGGFQVGPGDIYY